ncbi:MAG: membrane protein insertion efficiency factor YidD [Actinomycetota bacterium]
MPFLLRSVIWYQRTFAGGAPTCRFYPSCSSYAREALEVHGTRRGVWLTLRRLIRCRPFGPSGVDLVPELVSDTPVSDTPVSDTLVAARSISPDGIEMMLSSSTGPIPAGSRKVD